jgi:hypothetical protein
MPGRIFDFELVSTRKQIILILFWSKTLNRPFKVSCKLGYDILLRPLQTMYYAGDDRFVIATHLLFFEIFA